MKNPQSCFNQCLKLLSNGPLRAQMASIARSMTRLPLWASLVIMSLWSVFMLLRLITVIWSFHKVVEILSCNTSRLTISRKTLFCAEIRSCPSIQLSRRSGCCWPESHYIPAWRKVYESQLQKGASQDGGRPKSSRLPRKNDANPLIHTRSLSSSAKTTSVARSTRPINQG